eukprot:m.306530 g.306530  ORF g.306530 m.306530 type:complete len:1559 (+) comp41333_c0_seq1:295-4971(+)
MMTMQLSTAFLLLLTFAFNGPSTSALKLVAPAVFPVPGLGVPVIPEEPPVVELYKYQVISQRFGIPGEMLGVFVHAEKSPSKVKPWPLAIHVDIVHGTTGKSLFSTPSKKLNRKKTIHFGITLPESLPAGTHAIHVNITTRQGDNIAITRRLTVRPLNRIVLIQTDKPVYKPGETVLGRVIVLKPGLAATKGNVRVEIRNPKDTLIASFKNLSLGENSGVVKFTFPLSAEPVLGQYKLCATYEGVVQKQDKCFYFQVDEYVLPKFSCTISPNDDQLQCFNGGMKNKRSVCYTISSKYTHGQNVKGDISATAFVERSSCTNTRETVKDKIDGTKSVCIDVCSRYRQCYGNVKLEASVTDPTSGDTVSCGGTKDIPIRQYPYQIQFEEEDSSCNAFYPCQKIKYNVKTSLVSGKPVGNTVVNLTCEGFLKKSDGSCGPVEETIFTAVQSTGENGKTSFEFCAPCNALEITCRARPGSESPVYIPEGHSKKFMIYSPERTVLTSPVKSVEVGKKALLVAYLSSDAKANAFVISKGSIVLALRCRPKRVGTAGDVSGDICDSSEAKFFCQMRFRVTSDMAPKITVVIGQKDLSADKLELEVTPAADKQITLTFDSEEVKPGDEVNLKIKAARSSYVGVVAVDQSVYLQQAKNQLTIGQVHSEVGAFEATLRHCPTQFYMCGGRHHWSCRCRSYGCLHGPSKDEKAPKRLIRPRPIPGPEPCSTGGCHQSVCSLQPRCQFVSAFSFFTASGLDVLSNFNSVKMSTPSCKSPPSPPDTFDCCYPPFYWATFSFARGLGGPDGRPEPMAPIAEARILDADEGDEAGDDSVEVKGKKENLAEVKRERNFFPETWIWSDIQFGENTSEHRMTLQAPGTITSWVADGFALSAQQAISIAKPTTLRVFQPFFVSVTLPYSVIRGEKLEVRVTVFNYLKTSLTAFVELEVESNEINIIQSKSDKKRDPRRQLKVPAGESRSVDYFIVPLKIGRLPMKVSARSAKAADAVIRSLLVEPEGVEKEYALSSLVCIEGEQRKCVTKEFNLILPPAYVPESESAVGRFTADYMGPSIEGLGDHLRLPYGCGEQNMMNFAPGVYITRYLTGVNKLEEKTKDKALKVIQTGYQREMTFQRSDGSYSAFGNRDKCGSMWLTAFVVRTFSQAKGIVDIDSKVQQEATDWIKAKQSKDGSFPGVCRVIHKEMQGCSGGECSLTAYTTLALLEAGVPPNDSSVASALAFLESSCLVSECDHNYALALTTYVFCKANHPKADKLIQQLRDCSTTESDTVYWKYSKENQQCYGHTWGLPCFGRSCDVETTAYALLAFTCHGDVGSSLNIVRWLTEQRNPSGGFKSTQDTVVALQALFEYAGLTIATNGVNANISLTSKGFTTALTIDSSNAQEVQIVDIPSIPGRLEVGVCGIGCVLTQFGVKYNLPEPPEEAAFEVTATASIVKKQSCTFQIEVCNRWLLEKPSSSNMALTDITMFSGFNPISSDIKALEKEGDCQIMRIDRQDRRIRVYLDEVTKEKCCFDLRIKRAILVEDLQGVPVLTYNYYDPDQSGGTMLYPREKCD